jgi:uncharacterized protein YerC
MWRKKMVDVIDCYSFFEDIKDIKDIKDIEENTNVNFGFDDVSDYVKKKPGKKNFCCDFCGIYTASRPRCNKCEEWD